MAIETPNRLAASITFYFAEEDTEPPDEDNPFRLIITAIEGITAVQMLGDDPPVDGFFLELKEKIRPEHGAFFLTGTWEGHADQAGFTPFAQSSGEPDAAGLEDSIGNWLIVEPTLPAGFGLLSVACWTITPTNTPIPVALPVPPA